MGLLTLQHLLLNLDTGMRQEEGIRASYASCEFPRLKEYVLLAHSYSGMCQKLHVLLRMGLFALQHVPLEDSYTSVCQKVHVLLTLHIGPLQQGKTEQI